MVHLGLCWVYVALDGEAATRDTGDATEDAQGMQPGMLYASFASKQGCAHLNNSSVGIPCACFLYYACTFTFRTILNPPCILSASLMIACSLHA